MNDQLTHTMLNDLIQANEPNSLSLYMPTHRIGTEAEQDPIRLRNLLDEAEKKLHAAGVDRLTIQAQLAPARRLQDDHAFWQHQSDGLVIFAAPDAYHQWRLPLDFAPLTRIADHFYVKPLLPLLTDDGRFYILALSQNDVRLYQATRYTIDELALEGIPTSVAEALPFDDAERQLQYHTGTGAGTGRRSNGGRAAIFHGHATGTDDEKETLRRFFRQVDDGLMELLEDAHAPLVIAAVEYVAALYKEVSRYPHHLDQGVHGNPEPWSADELHRRAWELVEPVFRSAREEALATYQALSAQGQATPELSTVMQAAHTGRIDTAFVAQEHQVWGTFDPQTYAVTVDDEPSPANRDLLDLIARQTLRHDGVVYALEPEAMPDAADVAATFRW